MIRSRVADERHADGFGPCLVASCLPALSIAFHASLTLEEARPTRFRLLLTPPDMVSDHPDWVTILSWQGRMENNRGLQIARLFKVGPGHYRSTQPVPVWGLPQRWS